MADQWIRYPATAGTGGGGGGSVASDVITTRYHDFSVANLPAAASTPIEIRIDDATAGTALPANITKITASCTFGVAIEVLVGASAGAAVRKFVMNLGEGTLVMECTIAAGDRLWVRSMNSSTTTSGVLSMNLLG